MSATLLDAPNVRTTGDSPAENLRISNAAVRVSVRWLGVRKTLTPEQRNQAAEPFDATGDFLSARKKLLDTKHAAYKALTAVRGKVITHWKTMTLPYPEPGLRLIKQSRIQAFDQQMADFRTELNTAVATLELSYPALQAAARQRLGSLYNANDYPATLEGLFGIDWDYPSVEPPDYLMQLNPEIYERERSRVAARFEEAVELAEQAFLSEFAKLVSHLTERLGSEENGDRKIFRDTVVTNLVEFFDRFRQLNVRSNTELDDLVARAQRVVRGVEAQQLRDDASLRQQIATQLSTVQASLDQMMVNQPRRRLIYEPTPQGDVA